MSERTTEVLRLLDRAALYHDPNPGRSHLTGQEHALVCAGFPWRTEEERFVAVVHDLARPLNDVWHGEVIAWMVKDRVSAEAFGVLLTHGQFQASTQQAVSRFAAEPWVRWALLFAHREAASFAGSGPWAPMPLAAARDLIGRTLD